MLLLSHVCVLSTEVGGSLFVSCRQVQRPEIRSTSVTASKDETLRVTRVFGHLFLTFKVNCAKQSYDTLFSCRGAGVAPMRRDAVHVADLVDLVVRELGPGVTVAVSVPPGLVVVGDPDRLRQVVSNLLTNAVVHGHGQDVEVTGRCAGDIVVLCVEDHGPGLDPDDLSQVFERFYRGSGSRAAGRSGSGLGLAIAQSIVEQHGGRIHAEPIQPTGFRVRVELPAPTHLPR